MGGQSQTTESTQEVKLPPWVEKQAKQVQNMANAVAQQPYTPYRGPTVAAFSPMQVNAMQGTNAAAGSFGLPNVDTKGMNQQEIMSALTGLPAPTTGAGGFQGYSGASLYDEAKAGMTEYERAFIDRFFMNPNTGKPAAHPFLPVSKYNLKAKESSERKDQRRRSRRLVKNRGEEFGRNRSSSDPYALTDQERYWQEADENNYSGTN